MAITRYVYKSRRKADTYVYLRAVMILRAAADLAQALGELIGAAVRVDSGTKTPRARGRYGPSTWRHEVSICNCLRRIRFARPLTDLGSPWLGT